MARVDRAMQSIKELRPDTFTLDEMDNELVCMTLLRSLSDEYSSFASSLQRLDKCNKEKLQEAFVAEELLRNRSSSGESPSGVLSASALATSTPTTVTCEFCSLPGHSQAACHRYHAAQQQAAQDAKERAQEQHKFRSRGGKGNAQRRLWSGACCCCLRSAGNRWQSKSPFQLALYFFSARC